MADALGLATAGAWRDYVTINEDDSIRQQVVSAVGQRLAGILTGAGYKTDLGLNVFLWRPRSAAFGANELPALNYRDISAEKVSGALGFFRWRLAFDLDIYLAEGSSSPAEARKMIEDVYMAIGLDQTWGHLAQSTEQPEDSMSIDQAADIVMGINITFGVIYDAPRWQI